MSDHSDQDKVWNIAVTNYGEYEYHELSKAELKEIFQEQWKERVNGILIGRDVECVGRLGVFFSDDMAFLAYEDFDNRQWRYSYDLKACEKADWNELVRLTPDDAEEYSFRRCSIIPKDCALEIVEHYINTEEVDGLYLAAPDGKPVIDRKL